MNEAISLQLIMYKDAAGAVAVVELLQLLVVALLLSSLPLSSTRFLARFYTDGHELFGAGAGDLLITNSLCWCQS